MKVFEVASGGGLVAATRPVPTPGPGEVLVRVQARSINARDVPIVEGRYTRPVPPGRIPLSDGAGVVEALGAGVSRFAPGDRVTSLFHPSRLYGPLRTWDELYGVALDGWLAEYVAVGEQSVVAAPEHLSSVEAATLPCAALTAWSAVSSGPDGAGPGDTVLVEGSGGVSVFALQLARLAGARVVTTTSSAGRAARLRELGADDVVVTRSWGPQARELTGGVDLAVAIGGAASVAQAIEALAPGGRISVVGLGSGGGVDLAALLGRGATLRTITVGSRADAEAMHRAITRHRLRPVIDRVVPFDEAPGAFASYGAVSGAGAGVGKVVIAG